MVWQGKIEFKKPITIDGKPHGIEHIATLNPWTSSDEGRTVHTEDTGKLWFGTNTGWEELTPGGVGSHNHDDLYYTETEVDDMFEGKNGQKQQVNWANVINKPSYSGTDIVYNDATSSITASNVQAAIDALDSAVSGINQDAATYEALAAAGDVGPGSDQVALGSHSHDASTLTYSGSIAAATVEEALEALDSDISNIAVVNDAADISYDNTTSGLGATDIQAAVDELDTGVDRADLVITREYWVDKSHPGTYTPTGSRIKPFKTIADAIAVATPGTSIYVGAGTYTEDFTVPNRVSMHGAGLSKTILMGTGTITIGDGLANATCHFTGFSIRQHINIDMVDAKVIFRDAYIAQEGYATVTSGDADGLSVSTTTSNPALTMTATAGNVSCIGNYFNTTSGSVIVQDGGSLSLANCLITSNDVSAPAIQSNAGQLVTNDTFIVNQGGGLAVDCDNSASALLPNIISDTLTTGDISTGSAVTIIEGVNGGQVTSSVGNANLLFTPAAYTSYDNTTSSLTATDTQAAIDEVKGLVDAIDVGVFPVTTDAPPIDAPDVGTARFNATNGTLYIYDGTTWITK